MKREKITFEQLALLSFIKFAVLDGVDMTVLMNMIKNNSEVQFDDSSNDYYIMNDGMIMLQNSFVEKFKKNIDRELYESLETTKALKSLDNINVLEFVLRKIKLIGLGNLVFDEVSENFSFIQKRAINRLYHDGMIMDYVHKDKIYNDYQAIKLTKRGELYLFLIDNKKLIDNFREELKEIGYNGDLLEAYLITVDLSEEVSKILTLEGFVSFCNEYDLEQEKNIKTRTLKPLRQ